MCSGENAETAKLVFYYVPKLLIKLPAPPGSEPDPTFFTTLLSSHL